MVSTESPSARASYWPIGAKNVRRRTADRHLAPRKRKAFQITATELNGIARAAIIGLKTSPNVGYRAPAATCIVRVRIARRGSVLCEAPPARHSHNLRRTFFVAEHSRIDDAALFDYVGGYRRIGTVECGFIRRLFVGKAVRRRRARALRSCNASSTQRPPHPLVAGGRGGQSA